MLGAGECPVFVLFVSRYAAGLALVPVVWCAGQLICHRQVVSNVAVFGVWLVYSLVVLYVLLLPLLDLVR